jgi:DNA-binding NarL/FixJ family response regulator
MTNKIRIVIADDHAMLRDGVYKLLAMEPDMEIVAEASNGIEALEMVTQHQPDILLLDLWMPGLDGFGTLERLKELQNKTKVIVLTAADDSTSLGRAVRLGALGVVLKYSKMTVLIDSVRRVHAGGIWLDPEITAKLIQQLTSAQPEPQRIPQPEPAPPSGRPKDKGAVLSPREREVVRMVAQGFKNKDIAEKLFISEQTVKNHLHNIFDKLHVTDRLELALYAIHNNLNF